MSTKKKAIQPTRKANTSPETEPQLIAQLVPLATAGDIKAAIESMLHNARIVEKIIALRDPSAELESISGFTAEFIAIATEALKHEKVDFPGLMSEHVVWGQACAKANIPVLPIPEVDSFPSVAQVRAALQSLTPVSLLSSGDIVVTAEWANEYTSTIKANATILTTFFNPLYRGEAVKTTANVEIGIFLNQVEDLPAECDKFLTAVSQSREAMASALFELVDTYEDLLVASEMLAHNAFGDSELFAFLSEKLATEDVVAPSVKSILERLKIGTPDDDLAAQLGWQSGDVRTLAAGIESLITANRCYLHEPTIKTLYMLARAAGVPITPETTRELHLSISELRDYMLAEAAKPSKEPEAPTVTPEPSTPAPVPEPERIRAEKIRPYKDWVSSLPALAGAVAAVAFILMAGGDGLTIVLGRILALTVFGGCLVQLADRLRVYQTAPESHEAA